MLYLPDGGDVPAPDVAPLQGRPEVLRSRRCPPEMVLVAGRLCVDRYEAVLEDLGGGRRLSAFYNPTPALARAAFERWRDAPIDAPTDRGRTMSVAPPPAWQLSQAYDFVAVVLARELPNGYLDGDSADRACRNAGKRLCTEAEWVLACRGEQDRPFPYGEEFQAGRCNVFREAHPAVELHGNASVGHLDPRLNAVTVQGRPLLRLTGATPDCRSTWGDDAIYDMVGNLDEWVDDPEGVFLGGFYARSTKEGCAARIFAHPRDYFDYSLGVRCCRDP
ncbi:MAG: SUMF1/EgtB/PvdO family nonheme iron enzyme [Polyangiaceae bacterium]|nr:SUMF1/EgtB/PvdO family nonheme iron enzyme [Polyangiaceae bacterium]